MTVHDNPSTVQRKTGYDYKVTLAPEVRETVTAYVERQNRILAPAELTITRVVNEAVKEYVALRDSDEAA